jgi:hypothetical protein
MTRSARAAPGHSDNPLVGEQDDRHDVGMDAGSRRTITGWRSACSLPAASFGLGGPRSVSCQTLRGGPHLKSHGPRDNLVFDFDHQSGTLDLELPGVGKLPVIYVTVLMVDGAIYEKPPPWERTGGKAWIRIDAAVAAGGTKAAPGGSSLIASPSVHDSSRALDLLLGAGKVTKVSRENLRDASTTHYRIAVDTQRLARRVPATRRPYYRQLIGSGSFPADAWVDDAGRVRKLSYQIDLRTPTAADQAGIPLMFAVTNEFYDFGVEVHVTEPPASEVAESSP